MGLSNTLRRLAVNTLLMSHITPNRIRAWGLNKAGIGVGAGTQIRSGSIIKTLKFTIGERSFVNHGCHVDDGVLTIGDGVYIGPRVVFAMGDHEIGPATQRAGTNISRPIEIQEGSWVGANATILSGVNVAPGCIIAAGAVLTRSTEPNGLYAGVPARRLKDLFPST